MTRQQLQEWYETLAEEEKRYIQPVLDLIDRGTMSMSELPNWVTAMYQKNQLDELTQMHDKYGNELGTIFGDLKGTIGSMIPANFGAILAGQGDEARNWYNEWLTRYYNEQLTAQERNWATTQAQENRDFQMAMSNTAHQREMADLVDAGLNPWNTVSGGTGATTPAGTTAQAGSTEPGKTVNVNYFATGQQQNEKMAEIWMSALAKMVTGSR